MTMIMITDRVVVAHLALAVIEYRRDLKRRRLPEPGALAHLEEMLRAGSQRVAEAPIVHNADPVAHDQDVAPPILFTLAEAAQRLNIGVTTIKGLANEGALPTVRIGRAVRVHEADLAEYAQSLRDNSRVLSTKGIE